VVMAEMRTHSATERAGLVTLRLKTGAPELYPDHSLQGKEPGHDGWGRPDLDSETWISAALV
jgi:hypothetical protein